MSQKTYSNLDKKAQEALALNHFYKMVPVEMKCRCFDKDCQSIPHAVDVLERYEAILGENCDKMKQSTRGISYYSETEDVLPENNLGIPTPTKVQTEKSITTKILRKISSRLECLERSSRKSTTQKCFCSKSTSHLIKDCPHLGTSDQHSQDDPRKDQEPTNSGTKKQTHERN
jgi:hypothetical protein